MNILRRGFAALAFIASTCSAQAQLAALPPEVFEQVRAIGSHIDPVKTAAIFAPFHPKEPYPGVTIRRDIFYGPAPRNRLDVFTNDKATSAPHPVIIYVHGGAYVRGDKKLENSPFHDNVMLASLERGFVGVNMTYRLAPADKWPAATDDVSQAIQWVIENIAQFGGDPSRIYLFGHSAGATHAGNYIAHTWSHGPTGIGLRAAVIVSGLFDLETYLSAPHITAYFGEDRSKYAGISSLKGILASPLPILLVDAEFDPPEFLQQTKQLNDALCAIKRCPERLTLAGHSHMSEIYSINTKDRQLMDAIKTFAAKH